MITIQNPHNIHPHTQSTVHIFALTQFPNVKVPRQMLDTFKPLPPRNRYSVLSAMSTLYCFTKELHTWPKNTSTNETDHSAHKRYVRTRHTGHQSATAGQRSLGRNIISQLPLNSIGWEQGGLWGEPVSCSSCPCVFVTVLNRYYTWYDPLYGFRMSVHFTARSSTPDIDGHVLLTLSLHYNHLKKSLQVDVESRV